MIPNWTAHLKDPEEAKRFRQHMYASKGVLDRLLQLTGQIESELDQQEADVTQYSSPSWAALQADRNGFRRALRTVNKLITLDQKDK